MYDLGTYDHVTCMHFHHLLHMTFSTCLQLVVNYMIPIDITSCALGFIILRLLFNLFNNNFSTTLQLKTSHTFVWDMSKCHPKVRTNENYTNA